MFSFHCAAHLWITVPSLPFFLISRYRHSINSYSLCQQCRHVEYGASTRSRPASPRHSPACAVGILTIVHRRNSLSSQWRAVVEVSLFPHGIVANALAAARLTGCVNRSGITDTVLAPPCLPLPPHGRMSCACYEADPSACLSRCRILYGANCSSIVLITSWSSADTRDAAFFRTLICSAHSVCNCG